MNRIQLALNVDDVDAAVAFYSKLFDTEPAKRRPGYANFAISQPPTGYDDEAATWVSAGALMRSRR